MTRQPVVSLGAGVQSSVLLLMAAEGAFGPVPEIALFADTGAEPLGVYEHLDWLTEQVAGRVEIVRVQKGDIAEDAIAAAAGEGNRFASIPFYIRHATTGQEASLRRQCTREYKLEPIHRELRARGVRPAEMWLGISLDEVVRMKPSRVKWVENRWPLIEQRMTRQDCERWFAERHPGRRLTKSACVFCPFHTDANWRDLRDNDPEGWERAVEFDAATRRLPRIDGEAFVHRQMVPLPMVDLSTPEDRGQLTLGFDDECEGMCGL